MSALWCPPPPSKLNNWEQSSQGKIDLLSIRTKRPGHPNMSTYLFLLQLGAPLTYNFLGAAKVMVVDERGGGAGERLGL